jgi:Aerotolerance regulator N-terminal/von Willebrand factor type A domain
LFAFLDTFLLAPWMLAGLGVLAIPPLIHLLNRRRHDTVDWGAMQFLQVSRATRRRLLLEEILLMLLRVGLLAALVACFAGPFFDASAGGEAPRDAVILIDGSASMAVPGADGTRPSARAIAWVRDELERRAAGDAVAVLSVRDRVAPLVGELTPDLDRVRGALAVPPPSGGSDWADAVRRAYAILAKSDKANREIVVLSDNQKAYWADAEAMLRWELLRSELGPSRPGSPRLRVIDLSAGRPAMVPNVALGPIAASRPVVPVDREVSFRLDLLVSGQPGYEPPHRLRLEIDGKHVRDLPAPPKASLPTTGRIPLTITQRFSTPGVHRVGVVVEADPPVGMRPAGYVTRDRVPGDDRQDFALEVVDSIGVLIIDGGGTAEGGPGFLRDALSPTRDPHPVARTRVVAAKAFAGPLPAERVVILHDVARLTDAQVETLSAFVAGGGGLLVTIGGRAEVAWYNEKLYRDAGWLPARLDGVSSAEARPEAASLTYPVLDVFARDGAGGFAEARFPRWMKLDIDRQSSSSPIGQLVSATGKAPFMVERRHGTGRVLLCAVPLDASWGTNLAESPAFVPLVHEAVFHLAGARSAEYNLRPGEPIRFRVPPDARLDAYRVTAPDGSPLAAQVLDGMLTADTREPGVYLVRPPAGGPIPFVVASDGREADLTPCTEEEQGRVRRLIGGDEAEEEEVATERRELGWVMLLGLLAFLLMEVGLTRRMAMKPNGPAD